MLDDGRERMEGVMARRGATAVLAAAGLVLAGCNSTTTSVVGAAAGGALALGGMAVGAATAVGSAGVAATGTALGAAGTALGAAGTAAAGIAGSGAVTTVAVTAPEAAAAASLAPELAAAAPAAEGTAAAGAVAAAEIPAVAAGASGAALVAQQALSAAGAEAVPTAETLLSSARGELDRCALQVFMGVVTAAGEADAARFALWLNQQAGASPYADSLSSFRLVAEHIQLHLRRTAEQARGALQPLLDVDPAQARAAFGAARDVRSRCPSTAGQRLAALVTGEEPLGT
jgi:hypothetical protein